MIESHSIWINHPRKSLYNGNSIKNKRINNKKNTTITILACIAGVGERDRTPAITIRLANTRWDVNILNSCLKSAMCKSARQLLISERIDS